ncbi:ZIP family metal transporter [Staphylothermus hellenicus]|uniref:Zinc/iron permease n=1 Tax=Staphylothermus hellenicus (strain DSM 12710 / JCM 10830 / BK20S6-10-b1 / P8) TaxID=591019 RepID=D7D9H3_STAHD|nr:ZIP family metal transporter [Staphylothermus hellenicus]ADI32419.1 zinc/iron permease [Staphylothermus hellenicus DSM 12710]
MLIDLNYIIEGLVKLPLPLQILFIGFIPAILTSIGSIPVVLGERIGEKYIYSGLGFSAGVMLVASFTSLLIPSLETGCYLCVYSGFVIGALTIYSLDKSLPHLHLIKGYEGPKSFQRKVKRITLVVLAIIIHNIPEGMAVGVSTIYELKTGLLVAIAIGIQDIPEGLAVSLPYYSISNDSKKSLVLGIISGFSELAAAYIPLGIIILSGNLLEPLMPFLMSISAGAMIYVVVHELVPEIYSHGHDDLSTLGFFIGFIIMFLLDTFLG